MKKTLLGLSLLAVNSIPAQVQKGAFLTGMGFNYYQNTSSAKTSTFTIDIQDYTTRSSNSALRAGYFVANNIAIGIYGNYGTNFSRQDYDNGSYKQFYETKSGLSSLGLFARMYKLYHDNKFGVFCHLEGAYLMGQSQSRNRTLGAYGNLQNSESKGDITGFNIGIRPGFVYFITDRIGLEATFGNFGFLSQLQQNYEKGQKTTSNYTKTFNLNLATNTLYLGFNFYFGHKA